MISGALYLSSMRMLYDSTPAKDGQCPSHVELLRKSLLDFPCPQRGGDSSLSESDQLDSTQVELEGRKDTDLRVSISHIIRESAVKILSDSTGPIPWHNFYNEHFFGRLASSTFRQPTDTRM